MALGRQLTTSGSPQVVLSTAAAAASKARTGATIVLRNNDATNDVVLGGSTVAAGTGYRLKPGQSLTLPGSMRPDLYAIAGAGTPVLDILVV